MFPNALFFECFSISIFCAILINFQRWIFLYGRADICADKLAGQLGASSEPETGATLASK